MATTVDPSPTTLLSSPIDSELLMITTTLSTVKSAPSISREHYEIVITVIGFIAVVVGVVGIVSNILIILTFSKIGINNSINTSYVAMAVADLLCALHTIWFMLLVIPDMQRAAENHYDAIGLLSGTSGFPLLGLAKTTAWIAAYISLERCLCVMWPHKVKVIFTKRFTTCVMIAIYILSLPPAFLAYLVFPLKWQPSTKNPNITVLSSSFSTTIAAYNVNEFLDGMYGLAFTVTPIVIIFLCSIFLIIHLQRSSQWRKKNMMESCAAKDGDNSKNKKEDRIVKVVLMIAIVTFVLNIPLLSNFVTITIDPTRQPYFNPEPNFMDISATFATSCILFNSVINIFFYYNLGTKFRETLKSIIC